MANLLSSTAENLREDLSVAVNRFFPSVVFSVLLFIWSLVMIFADDAPDSFERLTPMALTLAFGILYCAIGSMLLERIEHDSTAGSVDERIRIVGSATLMILTFLIYPAMRSLTDDRYVMAAYIGMMLAFVLGVVFLADHRGISKTFSHLFTRILTNGIVSLIIFAGLSLALYAFTTLIYDFDDSYRWFMVIYSIAWVLVFVNLCLASIPQRESALSVPRIFKILVLSVALPVYLVLIVILYIYLGKILVTMSFPVGQINWFASVAAVFFILFYFALHQYDEDRFARLFTRWGGLMLIPIIAMQLVAVFIRLSNYGLTSARYVSLVLTLVALVFALLTLLRDVRLIKWMLPVVALVALVLTLTPLNLFDVPMRNQTARLTEALERNGLLVDGKFVAREDVAQDQQLLITGAYEYLTNYPISYSRTPTIARKLQEQGFTASLGFAPQHEQSDEYWYDEGYYGEWISYYHEPDEIDIAGFRTMQIVSYYDESNWDIAEIDRRGLTAQVKALYESYGNVTNVPLEFTLDEGKLVLTNIDFNVKESGEIEIIYMSGYYLLR